MAADFLSVVSDGRVVSAAALGAALIWRSRRETRTARMAWGTGAIGLIAGAIAYHCAWTPGMIAAMILMAGSGLIATLTARSTGAKSTAVVSSAIVSGRAAAAAWRRVARTCARS